MTGTRVFHNRFSFRKDQPRSLKASSDYELDWGPNGRNDVQLTSGGGVPGLAGRNRAVGPLRLGKLIAQIFAAAHCRCGVTAASTRGQRSVVQSWEGLALRIAGVRALRSVTADLMCA